MTQRLLPLLLHTQLSGLLQHPLVVGHCLHLVDAPGQYRQVKRGGSVKCESVEGHPLLQPLHTFDQLVFLLLHGSDVLEERRTTAHPQSLLVFDWCSGQVSRSGA